MKRAIEHAKQVIELHKGAGAIEKMADASRKRAKVAEEMIDLDKQRSMIALFSMPGTDEDVRKEFMELAQMKAFSEMQKSVRMRIRSIGHCGNWFSR